VNLPEAERTAHDQKQAAKLTIPTYMVRSGDKYYVINGHHRVVANHMNGRNSLPAKVFDPAASHAMADFDESKHPRADDGKFTNAEGGGSSGFQEVVDRIRQPDGGFSYHATTGQQPTTGYALSIHKDRERVLDAKDVTFANLWKYAQDNKDLLSQRDNYFGGWHDPESGKVYLDVSTVVNSAAQAAQLGKAHGQLAYLDLKAGKSVSLKEQHGQETGTAPDRPEAGRPDAGRRRGALPQSDWEGSGPAGTGSRSQGHEFSK